MKIQKNKILTVGILLLLTASSFTVQAKTTNNSNSSTKKISPIQTSESLPYEGHLRIYVVEPLSRWNMYNGQPYHFGSLGYAFNGALSIPYLGTYENNITWNGDVTENNVIVMAAIFSPDTYQAYSQPPSSNKFDAHYVDAAAATTPGSTGYNFVNATYTHTVFVEEATATWCKNCPTMAEVLYTVYQSGGYPFYYVALINDSSPDAPSRLGIDYNVWGFPTGYFDGGYKILIGAESSPSSYQSRIVSSGKRVVHNLNLTISTEYIGNGDLKIHVKIFNNQTSYAPETPATPNGPMQGHAESTYTYTSNSTDLDGGDLFYLFDWGDGTNSGWVGPYKSGATSSASKAWNAKGTYSIKVKAKDRGNHESNWSNPLSITISPPAFLITILGGLSAVSATIKNNENNTLPAVNWSITVTGGIFKRVNVTTKGIISNFSPGDQANIATDKLIFGFGRITITVTAETAAHPANGFIVGPFVVISK